MSGKLALERFGGAAPDHADDPDPAAPGSGDPRDHRDPVLAEIVPPPAEPDPEAEQAAALARIATALERILTDQGKLRDRCIAGVSAALGAAAETLLPRLARDGFARIVADTAEAIARQGQWPTLVLRVAPSDLDPVTRAVDSPAAGAALRIAPDSGMASGEARFEWTDGGAEIDLAAIVAEARETFRERLAAACKEQKP